MRTGAWLPGGGFLLGLLLAGLLLLASDLAAPERPPGTANGGSWARLVIEDGAERFVRVRPGEPLHELLAREQPGLALLREGGFPSLLMAPGTEVWIQPGRAGSGRGLAYRVLPLPEGVRYLLGMPMNVNRADPEELAMLPGIGDVLAGRIVEERDRRNGFASRQDLLQVSGIGPKRLERIERHVTCGP